MSDKVIEALKNHEIFLGAWNNAWLVWGEREWHVNCKKARKTFSFYDGDSLDEAVEALLRGGLKCQTK